MENDLCAAHGDRYYGIEPMTDMIQSTGRSRGCTSIGGLRWVAAVSGSRFPMTSRETVLEGRLQNM